MYLQSQHLGDINKGSRLQGNLLYIKFEDNLSYMRPYESNNKINVFTGTSLAKLMSCVYIDIHVRLRNVLFISDIHVPK